MFQVLNFIIDMLGDWFSMIFSLSIPSGVVGVPNITIYQIFIIGFGVSVVYYVIKLFLKKTNRGGKYGKDS